MSSGIGSVPSQRDEASPDQHPSKALHNRSSVDIDREDEPDPDDHSFPGHRLFSTASGAGGDGQRLWRSEDLYEVHRLLCTHFLFPRALQVS